MTLAVKQKGKTKKASSDKKPTSGRRLLNAEEWEDGPRRKVISEYHKGTFLESPVGVEVGNHTKELPDAAGTSEPHQQTMKVSQVFDMSTVEMLAYALSRALFRRGVQVPLKVKNVVDMDIAVKDTDVILNTNDVSFELPPLQIWRVIFSYKGKPVLEYGRGINNDFKIHYSRAISLLLAMWVGRRKRRRAREEATEKACEEVAATSRKEREQNAM
jgi:hypothetical protein